MKTDSQCRSGEAPTGEKNRAACLSAVFLPWAVATVLVLTNVATLLNEQARSAALDILAPLIVVVAGESAGPFKGAGAPGIPVDDVVRQNTILVKRVRGLESSVARLEDENSAVKTRKAEVDSRLQKLQTEHAALRDRQAALETERNALKEMSVRRAKALRNVADRITGKLAVNAGGLIAELPVRAAPYVGVLALVTGTALEIRSDCELARTLNGLVLEHQEAPLDTHAVCQYADRIPARDQVWNVVKKQSGSMAASVYQTIESFYKNP